MHQAQDAPSTNANGIQGQRSLEGQGREAGEGQAGEGGGEEETAKRGRGRQQGQCVVVDGSRDSA